VKRFLAKAVLGVAKIAIVIGLIFAHYVLQLAVDSWLPSEMPRLKYVIETGFTTAILVIIGYLVIETVFLFVPIGKVARVLLQLLARVIPSFADMIKEASTWKNGNSAKKPPKTAKSGTAPKKHVKKKSAGKE